MNALILGMRRSGTTILFDCLSEDPELEPLYEPLAALEPSIGGGSGARDTDLFATVRARREAFCRQWPGGLDTDLLNHGAPRAPELELEPDAPDYVRSYLAELLDGRALLKCVRLHRKVALLRALDRDAHLIHIVRDPRAVTTSHLWGRGGSLRNRYPDERAFFTRVSVHNPWSARAFSDLLYAQPEHAHLAGGPDFERILLLWADAFAHTHQDGLAAFGERYTLVRHEDLAAAPEPTLRWLYDRLGRPVPAAVLDWARAHVRPAGDGFAPGHPAWAAAAERIGMQDELRAAGYALA